ncbi:Molybdenum cofactor guanylyltransferase [Roseobacter fucihabitans]|uniref:Molybdenum cofactor guanylyltransferase n=1 Tax=Roseobacter fucihabitans TaxID=1537242 RepID=A0ABZ2BTG3_9RHOB|nr:nucleotidyltransferase family protein [Roseobacter litoralis]MBC6966802.1 molybdopterin-guanine dinucleotide biosynthesis protein A [Roseobacter litoralis]
MSMQAPRDLPIIILAAGQSKRMRGADKLLEEIDGVPLLRRQANLACSVTLGQVLIALPPPPHPRYQCLDALAVNRIGVPDAVEGMSASIRTAIAALPEDAPAAMLLLGDLPDLTKDDIKNVIEAIDFNKNILIWRGATEDGEPGHPIVFAAELFGALMGITGDEGGQSVVRQAKDRVALIRLPGHRARKDLDTPEDWAAWRAQRRG